MSRSVFRSALLSLVLVVSLVGPVAEGADRSSSDRALAARIARPGVPLDPVLSALSAGSLVRDVAAPVAGQVELPTVPLGFALTGAQLAPLDVTGTVEASRAVDAFTSDLRSRGIETTGTSWTVYTLPPVKEALDAGLAAGAESDPLGSSLIVPTGTVVELVGAVWEAGQLHAKTTVSASGQQPRAARQGFQTMAAPSDSLRWEMAGGAGCLHREQNATAHYDPCQWFYSLSNDGDPTHDYWASQMYGTGKGKSIWTLNGLEVDSRRQGRTSHQEWVDWDPGADANTNCHSQTVSVSYAGVGVAVDKQHCEVWDIDKGENAADMSNWWRGHVRQKERETAATTATRTAAGEVPTDVFDFDFYANP
jgi:hypothetical protein